MLFPRDDADHPLARSFRHFLQDPTFPCVGVKSALSRNEKNCGGARHCVRMGRPAHLSGPHRVRESFKREPNLFRSFAVIFETPSTLSEADSERHLWARVQSLSDKDAWLGLPYDERVRPHPDDPHFSLSLGGEAFFIVGLHPNASRKARRFEVPTLVFNLHDQFEQPGAIKRCGSGSSSGTSGTPARPIPCWPSTASRLKCASTVVARWTRTGHVRFIPEARPRVWD